MVDAAFAPVAFFVVRGLARSFHRQWFDLVEGRRTFARNLKIMRRPRALFPAITENDTA